jgi:hypothetical protein
MLHEGASIIPFLEINEDLVVVLFGDSKYNIHMDAGGHAEKNESIFDTAIREAREESLNTFDICISKLNNYVELNGYYGFFNKYNINFEDLSFIYNYNKKIIYSASNVPEYWKETKTISIFTIDSLISNNLDNNEYYECLDYFNELKIIHFRPIEYILKAINNNIIKKNGNKWNIVNIPSLNIIPKKNNNSSLEFLNGTISINIF